MVTAEDVRKFRGQHGVSMQEADRYLHKEMWMQQIRDAKTMDEMKVPLLALIERFL